MTTTTVLARNGSTLSEAVQVDSWYSYLNGYEPAGRVDDLVEELVRAQQAEFNGRLPQGCHWLMSTSEVVGPIGTELVDDIDDLMTQACDVVTARFDEIEAQVLAARAE